MTGAAGDPGEDGGPGAKGDSGDPGDSGAPGDKGNMGFKGEFYCWLLYTAPCETVKCYSYVMKYNCPLLSCATISCTFILHG